MIKKKQLFYWEHKQEKTFKELKDKFTLVFILASFDLEKKIVLKTNTSDQALGSCLSQPDTEKQLHLVAYQSRKFSGPELNYDVQDKKLLAIVNVFEEWRVYLEESTHRIVIYSDYKNLLYFTITKKLNQ